MIVTTRRFRPMLADLPSRITPSGSGPLPVAMALAPAAGSDLSAHADGAATENDHATSDHASLDPSAVDCALGATGSARWSGPMMPSDDELDLTPWTLAEMAPPADFPA